MTFDLFFNFLTHQKGENQFGPLQIVTFHQLTTVDKKFYLEQRLQPNQQKYQGRLI